jgi:hypothetical protein
LECVGGVCGGGYEVIPVKEILYFRFVLLCGEYENRVSFTCVALFFCSLFLIEFTSLVSGCGSCVAYGLLFCCGVRSATIFLYASLSPVGNCVMVVSASSARFYIHLFFLSCMLYLGPFCNNDISELEKEMSVLLTTLG